MSSIIKGLAQEDPVIKKEPEVHVPGYGTMPLDMLKRHVQSLSKDFDTLIQQGAYIKAAYRSEQFFNALLALAKALPKPNNVDETRSTGTSVGSAGIGGGSGLGIEKSPIEKVLEKPLGEEQAPMFTPENSDISGLMHAAKHLNNSYIITAKVDGVTKKFRVNAQSANVAKEKFKKHYSMAEILDVKQKNSESSIMKGIQSEGE